MNVASVVQMIAGLSWLLFIGAIVFAVMQAARRRSFKGLVTLIIVAGVVALLLSSASAGLVFIQPEQRGVVISAVAPKGYREQALQPGLRWIIPFFENVVTYPISKQTYTMSIAQMEGNIIGDDSISARTADGQEVLVDASVIFSVDPAQVVQVHIVWQNRYANELVRPLARGIIRDAISQFGVEEVYSSQRGVMAQQIRDEMGRKLNENGLLLGDFVLRNITFSPEYAASVEQKQIAEQTAQQARFVVEQRKQEAEQARQVAQGKADAVVIEAEGAAEARIIEAQAEAEALRKIAEALQENQELLTYQYINQLAPGIQVMLVPNNAPYLLPLPSLEQPAVTTVPQPTTQPPATTP
ncbi:MAG TPA: SPFH domain-containing protein [Anaerolineales bacterium]|nr:SPFH domain-containing protein [Anaerolineales bacterium]